MQTQLWDQAEKNKNSIYSEIEKRFSQAESQAEVNKARIDKLLTDVEKRQKEDSKDLKELMVKHEALQKELELVSSRLQEFENISLDIEDVEKSFLTREEFDKRLKRVALQKDLDKASKKVKSIEEDVSELEEDRFNYVETEHMKKVEEDLVSLKSELVLKQDVEDVNSRLEKAESKLIKDMDKIREKQKTIEKDLAEVYSMKKGLVSKDQLQNLRKEIKMLLEGLKEIDKIKKKLNQKPAKKAKSK